ncbi:MAG: hypothetical protein HY841_03105 [Bacteroidetes bacterium]|nr:hypothetical protein [Bacteroidota bacterium]
MATTFPRIYSLGTVGVRQHYNSEYLFHAVRTDFTGGNGLGKSIIGDLMQLIIIPRRDMWKPGTEGIGKDERRVEGIPLNKEYIQYAYAFLNIERKQGQFLTIGVYISKTPRIPVRPFIISASPDFESGSLTPFSRPLHPDDFLGENKTIFDLREMHKHLKEKHGLYMKDFFQTEGIMKYYDLLYKNNILPVNLTKPDNLKTYSKVIQSFARAKSLDITNSKSLQNFLFEDNDEIKRVFEEQKEQLSSLIKQYRDNFFHTQELQLKQKKLLALLETNRKSTQAKEDFLKSSASFSYQKYNDALNRHENNKKHIETSVTNLMRQKNELEKVTEELYNHYTNLQKVCLLMREKYETLLKDFSDDTILARKQQADVLRDKINLLSALAPIVEQYGSVEKIEKKLKEQESFRDKKNNLNKILSLYSLSDFENSEWAKMDYLTASKHYSEKLSELPQQIEELETLVELFEGTRDDSFFHWAIQNNKPLTKEQETVLMHLKELPVTKPEEVEEGTKYISNPLAMLSSFEKVEEKKVKVKDNSPLTSSSTLTLTSDGIWIAFGEVREFVPLIKKQRFTNTKNLKTVLEKDTKAIKAELEETHKELNIIQRLSDELVEIGFNQELSDIYRKRKSIESYTIDNSLNEEKISLIKENWDDIEKLETLQTEFATIDNEAIELAKKQSDIRNKINSAKSAFDTCEYEFTKLRLESSIDLEVTAEDHSQKGIELLDENKITYEARIRTLNEQKTWSEKYIIASEGELRGYRSSEPLFKQQMEESLTVFNEKKLLLEGETGIIFEPTLITGELNENSIERLEKKSEALIESYHEEFTRVTESFEETKGDRSPELVMDKYNFRTLVNILCGKLGLEGLGPELERLNEELKKFGDLQLTIILDVFKKVELQYNAFRKLITELNFFFKENKISGVYNFQVDFNERRDIAIDWIRRMREHAKHQRLASKLFITAESEASPETLILNIAKTLSDVGDKMEMQDLLDPKFYFDLRVGLFDELGARYPGSGGEAYTALALLCIGRMSVIQRDKNRQGVRFILLEELSNIDDTNFGLFPEIAKMFGYQLMTMTPKPFGSYSESEWYLHMLIRGKDKNINYQPMSFFRTKMNKQRLEEYMAGGKIEAKEPLVISAPSDSPEGGVTESFSSAVTLSEVEGSILNDTISDAETIIEAEMASETSTEIKVEEVKEEVPELPKISDELQSDRKEEFLGLTPLDKNPAGYPTGLSEEGKVEDDHEGAGKKNEEGDVKGE